MKGPPLGPGGEDITWPHVMAPRGRRTPSTQNVKPQTSNLFRVYPISSGTRPAPGFPECFGPPSPGARLRRLPRIFPSEGAEYFPWMVQASGLPLCFLLPPQPLLPGRSDHPPSRMFLSERWVTLPPHAPRP